MSTYHPQSEKESGQPAPTFPSTQIREAAPDRAASPSPPPLPKNKKRQWFVVSTMIVLLLAVSLGAVMVMQWGRQPVPPTPTPQPTVTPVPPPAGQWAAVLHDYSVTSLAAAPSHPNVLYACAVAPRVPVQYRSVETILRSTDFGTHWQDIGKHAQMSRGCELIINPTDSNEIYVATDANPPTSTTVSPYVLEHTSNGGENWETIHPTVHFPGLNTALAWQGTELSFVGNRLYSLQALPLSFTPTPQDSREWHPTALGRLLVSTDGGHTWNVLDTSVSSAGQTAMSYAVSPTKPTLFYELAYVPVEPGTGFPSLELYQSADAGTTWQLVLQHLPWLAPLSPAKVLIGSENTAVVYLTNTRCTSAQTYDSRGGGLLFQPRAGGRFSLCMSSDEGKSWRTITPPDSLALTVGGGMIDQQGHLYIQATTSGSGESWRYDPATATWSKVTQMPGEGTLLAGAPVSAHGTTILWFMSTTDQAILYRYVI